MTAPIMKGMRRALWRPVTKPGGKPLRVRYVRFRIDPRTVDEESGFCLFVVKWLAVRRIDQPAGELRQGAWKGAGLKIRLKKRYSQESNSSLRFSFGHALPKVKVEPG